MIKCWVLTELCNTSWQAWSQIFNVHIVTNNTIIVIYVCRNDLALYFYIKDIVPDVQNNNILFCNDSDLVKS
jgi:5'(3')-deoxyribonucleotidase